MQADMKMYEELVASDAAQALLSLEIKWPPLPGKAPLPEFPVFPLPSAVGKYIIELANFLQLANGAVGVAVIGAFMIAALGAYVTVKPGYREFLQLYLMIIASPSERKSALLAFVLNQIMRFISETNAANAAEKAAADMKREMLNKQLNKAKEKNDEERANSLLEQIEALPDIKVLYPPLTDTTSEALGPIMQKNGGMASIASAEGAFLSALSSMYSELSNIDIPLQGYSGDSVYVARISREPVIIKNAMLAILLIVQPHVVDCFLSNEQLLARGLCSRFLYCHPASLIGHREIRKARPVSRETENAFNDILHTLLKQSCEGSSRELTLSPEAMEAYYCWAEEVESKIGPGAAWNSIANGFEGKLVGNTIRLAGIVKLMDSPDYTLPVTEVHFSAAVELARYFIEHALAITGKATVLTPASKEVLAEITGQGKSPFSPYDLRQKLRFRKQFKDSVKVDEALAALSSAGYIRQTAPPEWKGTGRRPEALFLVHPDLLPKN